MRNHLAQREVLDFDSRDSDEAEIRILCAGPVFGKERNLIPDSLEHLRISNHRSDPTDADVAIAAIRC